MWHVIEVLKKIKKIKKLFIYSLFFNKLKDNFLLKAFFTFLLGNIFHVIQCKKIISIHII
jgi:hypothetical protein